MMTSEQIARWRKAGNNGNLYARFVLGTLYATGNGVPIDQVEATKLFESAAGKIDIAKDTYLGVMNAQGYVIPSDDAEAFQWIEKDAIDGFSEAQLLLGSWYVTGVGVAQNDVKAVEWRRKAAEQGHARAQRYLGVDYAKGCGVVKDEAEAIKWFRKAAEQGDAAAQFCLGVSYETGFGTVKDEAEAVKWYRKAAEQGDADAQFSLGVCYANGCGDVKDEAEAVKWYRKAAEQGHAAAQYNLFCCYGLGRGVEKDEPEATKWCRKAAEQGHAEAQYYLGVRYANGCGVVKDEADAVKWYRKAAEQGYAAGQSTLASCYDNGRGVEKDEAEAFKWYLKAAEQGHSYAQYCLGWDYDKGRGVAKDESDAQKWYWKAALNGEENAQKELGIDPTQRKLMETVRRYGREIALDERRCEAVLKDLCGGDACRREVHLLMCAVRGGAVAQLLQGGNGVPKAVLEARLIKRLSDDLGIKDELAGWSVKSWMMALGMMAPSGDPKQQSQLTPVLGRRAGDVDVVSLGGGEKLELVWCPPGTFMMGSPADEVGRRGDEIQHSVTLTKGFWMGKYEVTQGQWQRVMGNNPSLFKGARNPVEEVSWDDCQGFIQKLNEVQRSTGRWFSGSMVFRLPTEAEWEYACRAGTAGAYAGNLNAMGWHDMNSGNTTHPVGQRKPNAWELYDMHGNVNEWCQDWHGDYPIGHVTDPTGPGSGLLRISRGGCWGLSARYCRSAVRFRSSPGYHIVPLGLRLVRSPHEP